MKPVLRKSKRINNTVFIVVAFSLLAVIAFLVYQIPWVHDRLEWRLDVAWTYVRNVFQPAGELPTALPSLASNATETVSIPTATVTNTPFTATPINNTLTPTFFPTPSGTPIPSIVKLSPPEFNRSSDIQDWNNCGPASLALYLRFYGWGGDQFTISNVIKPIRADRNVNIDELQYYVRTQAGWLNAEYRVGGTLDLLKRIIAAGYPVMIEEAFQGIAENYWPNDDRWMGHYLLLTGYDDSLKIFISQDTYYGPNQIINYVDLEKNWQAFNHVYMIVYPVQGDAAIQSLLGDNWDEEKNREISLETAEEETRIDPGNVYSWFNLGTNQLYFDQFSQAAASYDKARELGLPQRMLRYQFGPFIAYFNSGRNEDLLAITEYALLRTPNSEEALVWRGWALYRDGDEAGAISEFEKALEAHPNYSDAVYGIDYINSH